VGGYSQAVVANGFVDTAGAQSRDPVSNDLVRGDITVHTRRALDNLEAILAGAGALSCQLSR